MILCHPTSPYRRASWLSACQQLIQLDASTSTSLVLVVGEILSWCFEGSHLSPLTNVAANDRETPQVDMYRKQKTVQPKDRSSISDLPITDRGQDPSEREDISVVV